MAVRDILFDIAPELSTTDATAIARVDRFIAYAAAELTADTWGDRLDMATALLAAHKLTLTGKGGNATGPVVSERAGDLSVGYANPVSAQDGLDPLDTTAYGIQFKQLRGGIYTGGWLL